MQNIRFENKQQINDILNQKTFDNAFDQNLTKNTNEIIANVIKNGDHAIIDYNIKFDNFTNSRFQFSQEEIEDSFNKTDKNIIKALSNSYERVLSYHQKQKPKDVIYEDQIGAHLGWKWYPIESVGLYVPGGLASYPSSVIMTAAIANAANVPNIAICVPTPNDQFNPAILAACKIANIDKIYRVGGAQAIAALAYGTEIIKPVNKIFGPGNKYVAEAKRQVFGKVGIDMIAGPSEVLVIADETAKAEWIAMDLLSQAEHDPDASVYLISDNMDIINSINNHAKKFIYESPRKEILLKSYKNNSYSFFVKNLIDEASQIANIIAPEHLEISTKNPEIFLDKIHNAGAIFLGEFTPEAIGDYVAGPSHVLPTSQTAKFSSGLSIFDFMRRSSVIKTNRDSFDKLKKDSEILAISEDLIHHAKSISIRDEK